MAEKKVTNFVCTVSEPQARELEALLRERGWNFSELPYAYWKAVHPVEKVNAVLYRSGKLTVQGSGTADFVMFVLEPEILHTFSFDPAGGGNVNGSAAGGVSEAGEGPIDPHGGIDESGKGDFFGPLAVAGVCVDEHSGPELRRIGCCDSKLIKSSARIKEIAGRIRQIVPGKYAVVLIGPGAYNRLYAKVGNLNRLLAWGHARVIENLLEKVPDCPRMLSDQFANERLIERALMTRGRGIRLDQRTRAESDVAVAAASILAREQFLLGMEKLEQEVGMPLPRGAGSQVRETGKKLFEKFGAEIFSRCAKTHFKTYQELTGGGNGGGEERLS